MKKFFTLLVLLTAVLAVQGKEKIKVACIGNSVTYGHGIPDREINSYPAQLQRLLGDNYDVRNFGRSSATLTSRSPMAYIKQTEYRDAMNFKADIVIIHLGLNDTDPRWWPNYSEEFIPEYRALIDSFHVANPKAKVYICLLTPIGHQHPRFQSGTRDWHTQVSDAIRKVAYGKGVELIDFYTPMYCHPEYLPDALHPDAAGAAVMAETVYKNLTGDYGGLQMPIHYGDDMVLQRDMLLVIRGMANAGDKIGVELTANGKKKVASAEAVANSWGQWSVELPAMAAGGPFTLSIATLKAGIAASKTQNTHLIYNNVWLGDVWICSGQSNMEFGLGYCTTAKTDMVEAPLQKRLHVMAMYSKYPTNNIEFPKEDLDSINALKLFRTAGWQTIGKADLRVFPAVAYHFGKTLTDSIADSTLHIGLICNPVGGTPLEAWIDRRTLQYEYPQILYNWLRNDHVQDWVRERAAKNIAQKTNPLQRHSYEPCYMYESGILPLEGTALKGVIWYQGESNAHNSELHERLFPLLQQSWQKAFRSASQASPALDFYFVQLSSLCRPSWPRFRNSQRLLAARLPQTWMAVSTDVGDSLDVHPKRKQQVGYRLGLQALRHTYGRDIVSQGPEPTSMRVEGKTVVVSFDHAAALRTADGAAPCTFEVAGADGVYYPATATIDGTTVRLDTRGKVAHPVSVRYGWQPFTRANLVNEAGLPCSTFEL